MQSKRRADGGFHFDRPFPTTASGPQPIRPLASKEVGSSFFPFDFRSVESGSLWLWCELVTLQPKYPPVPHDLPRFCIQRFYLRSNETSWASVQYSIDTLFLLSSCDISRSRTFGGHHGARTWATHITSVRRFEHHSANIRDANPPSGTRGQRHRRACKFRNSSGSPHRSLSTHWYLTRSRWRIAAHLLPDFERYQHAGGHRDPYPRFYYFGGIGINGCNFLLPPFVLECFVQMGLTEPKITESSTTSCAATSIPTALPQLKPLGNEGSGITGDMDETSLLPRTPFLGGDLLALCSDSDQHDHSGPPTGSRPPHGLTIWTSTQCISCTKRYL
jgi:hypothetical protein